MTDKSFLRECSSFHIAEEGGKRGRFEKARKLRLICGRKLKAEVECFCCYDGNFITKTERLKRK